VRFECLEHILCLVALVIVRVASLYCICYSQMHCLKASEALLLNVCVFESETCQSHSVDYFIVCPYHLFLCPAMHRFDKDVVCVKVDCHHDKSVALLGSEWE
jgi:hypothetical protein